jgi:hypothetical protein
LNAFASADRYHGIEGDAVVLLRLLQHVRVTVRQHHQPVARLQPRQRLRYFGERLEPFDAGDKPAHFRVRVCNARAREHAVGGEMADLPIRRVLPVQQRVDHRVLEVRAPPPGDEIICIALPALALEEAGHGFAESTLHVDDCAVLVEHADLDGALEHLSVHDGISITRTGVRMQDCDATSNRRSKRRHDDRVIV